MTDAEILDLVRQMRAAQKGYFKARREGNQGRSELDLSRALERDVDRALAERARGQKALL
jgi:hypothetical protein